MAIAYRDRTKADRKEEARRVAAYQRQMEQRGCFDWLPHVMDPRIRMEPIEEVEEEDD